MQSDVISVIRTGRRISDGQTEDRHVTVCMLSVTWADKGFSQGPGKYIAVTGASWPVLCTDSLSKRKCG